MKTTIKTKRCTMNCGPAKDDPLTWEERTRDCEDCETIDMPAQSDTAALALKERIAELESQVRDSHETNIAIVGENARLSEQLAAQAGQAAHAHPTIKDSLTVGSDVSDINVGDMPENGAGISLAHKRVTLSDERIDEIMTMVQEFASSWSLVGGRFDDGSMLEAAKAQKTAIRASLSAQSDVSDINVGDMPENGVGIGLAHELDLQIKGEKS